MRSLLTSPTGRTPSTPLQPRTLPRVNRVARWPMASASEAESKYGWNVFSANGSSQNVQQIPVAMIRRPLQRTRKNDQDKVKALMASIKERGLLEPIDILEVEGQYFGFSGCHRYEAFQKLELESIPCRVRKATRQTLRMHLM